MANLPLSLLNFKSSLVVGLAPALSIHFSFDELGEFLLDIYLFEVGDILVPLEREFKGIPLSGAHVRQLQNKFDEIILDFILGDLDFSYFCELLIALIVIVVVIGSLILERLEVIWVP